MQILVDIKVLLQDLNYAVKKSEVNKKYDGRIKRLLERVEKEIEERRLK